jgi:hypothetical protein
MQRRITRGVIVIDLGKSAFHKLFNLAFQTHDESGGILPFYRGHNDVTFRLVLRARSLIPGPAATNE